MKQLLRLNLVLAIIVLGASLIAMPGGVLSPVNVYAAACEPSPNNEAQVNQQQDCVNSYKALCAKSFDNNFCSNLSVDEINQCATTSTTPTFKQKCMNDLEAAFIQSNEASTTSARTNESDCKAASPKDLNTDNCQILNMIVLITNVMAGLAGIVIVATMIWGGILYSMAGADPNKVGAAKAKLLSGITALMLLIFGYSLLQWLTPGGLF